MVYVTTIRIQIWLLWTLTFLSLTSKILTLCYVSPLTSLRVQRPAAREPLKSSMIACRMTTKGRPAQMTKNTTLPEAIPSSKPKQSSTRVRKRQQTTSSSSSAEPKINSNSTAAAHAKFVARLEEMHQRARKGEELSQSFCDSVLSLCAALEEWDSVLDVLEVMQSQGLSQQKSSYRACLQACFELGNGASAEEIWNAMAAANIPPDAMDVSLVVTAMCRNQLNSRDQPWWRKAKDMLQSTTDIGVVPVETYDALLSVLPPSNWRDAVRILHELERNDDTPAPILSTYRTVIQTCVTNNQAEEAFQILVKMPEKGLKPTVYTFELVISALARKLLWRRSLQLLDVMDELDIPMTVVTYNTVISACSRAGEVGTAKSLLSKMKRRGVKPNIISYNSVMSACAGTPRWKDALLLLDQCHREPGVQPDIITFTNAMRACSRGGKTNQALTLLQVVKDKKLPIDNYCYTAVIDACAKGKMWQKALELLDEMEQNGIVANEITYSVVINACGNGGQWERALALLDKMREKNMRINVITYNSAITALSKASRRNAKYSGKMNSQSYLPESNEAVHIDEDQLWIRALELIEQMKADGLEPDGFSYSAAISCCGSGGRWKEALHLIKTMKKGGPKTQPNKVAYTAAISACGRSGEYQLAVKLFADMKNQGLQLDRVAYNALFSALRVSQMADKAFDLWGEMCGKTQLSSSKLASARAPASISPDIITVTDVIATLSRSDDDNKEKVDQVFGDAVDRGIVMRSDTLDSDFEVDLTGMSLPVARAACRFIFRRIEKLVREGGDTAELTLITGVGSAKAPRAVDKTAVLFGSRRSPRGSTALREYILQVLKDDFRPSISGAVPNRAQGTVLVDRSQVEKWLCDQ